MKQRWCWEYTGWQAYCGDCVQIGCLEASDQLQAGHIFISYGHEPMNFAPPNGKTRVVQNKQNWKRTIELISACYGLDYDNMVIELIYGIAAW